MERPQEFVRFFDGAYLEHPHMKGLYMRDGYGIQRWANGQVYVGQWKNHVYSGDGTLWGKWEDYKHSENRQTPVYTGQWKEGLRHGAGTLNWEQDIRDFSGNTGVSWLSPGGSSTV